MKNKKEVDFMKKRNLIVITAIAVVLSACGTKTAEYTSNEAVIEKTVKPETERNTADIEKNEVASTSVGKAPSAETENERSSNASMEESVSESDAEVMSENNVAVPMEPCTKYANTNANVRKMPGTDYDIIGSVNTGDAVTVNGLTESGWYQIDFNGSNAYVSASLLQDEIPIVAETPDESETLSSNTGYTNELCYGLAKEIFDATNAERIAAGVDPLIWDDRLADPAYVRANEIIDTFDHVRPDGTKCYALSDLIWGENIARGPHASGQEFVDHWMASEGHKANILQAQYKTMGVGFTCNDMGDTAVQLFGVE